MTFLLRLQRIEQAFYDQAAATGQLQGELAEYIDVARTTEADHVKALASALSVATAALPVRFESTSPFKDEAAFVAKAIALEDAVVAAINGQVTNLTPERLMQVCAMASVEARQAAWIHDIGGTSPAASAADAPLDADAVTDRLRDEGLWT